MLQMKLREDLSLLVSKLDLAQETNNQLISIFYPFIHPKFPVVDQEAFPILFQQTFQNDCNYDFDMAICLLVLALGQLGSTESAADPTEDMPGTSYFSVAYRILMMTWAGSFGSSLMQPTGLVLAAVYFCFKTQPLAA